ncbi:hypothetical protein LH435_06265 [Laribacter hongkongensis]|uniref:hypothetical protein n=1 Tax=Laribacter hongkongensis TaxID=168471 RepID=UPI001EFDC308|nr:hypothetical protein [Laribacter hongkongensis]MCG8995720.1 hypothetical protein [Laribacter hongkongensis]MCG9009875.1 hypothetical protein [Laribacter hongkongensis]MCG9023501.1 hypothetical protein [Laribacter hongkongensis]MCG9047267.1 hypothetical protein [Laribacter hongkongensis]MCG9073627.1 hypothetical protein [Laribacter hongkongensis]
MNAAKKIRKLIENGTDAEQIAVLTELARALEFGRDFNLARLYDIDQRYFELAVELINDWRFDHHIGARSRLTTLLVSGEPAPAEAAVQPVDSTPATGTVPAEAAPASDTPAAEPAPAARKRKRS